MGTNVLFTILIFIIIIVGIISFSDIPIFLLISSIMSQILRAEKNLKAPQEDDTIQAIDKMSGNDFEKWCANLLLRNNFTQIEITPSSGDQGVDIIAVKDGKKYAIQCKRYNQKLGNKPVQEVHAGKTIYGCNIAVVVTNNYFTNGGKEAARALGVELWDRDVLQRMLVHAEHMEDKTAVH